MLQKNFINIYVKVFEGKSKEGKTFDYYKLVDKNGKFTDLRFTRKVVNRPTQDSILKVHVDNINFDKNRLYPCYWVKQIEEIKPINEVRKEKNDHHNLVDLDIDENNLPF